MSDNTPRCPPLHGRVVVGYDGSAHAQRALDHAVDEAVRRDTALQIMCGDPWAPPPPPAVGRTPEDYPSLYRAARGAVDRGVERARGRASGLDIVPSVISEPAAEALLDAGRTAALTVVGTRGHGGFAGLLLGSVSLRVAAHCTGPLLVVRGDADLDTVPRGRVVVGVQSDEDSEAVRFGFEEARRRGAELHVLHTWLYPAVTGVVAMAPPGPSGRQQLDDAARRRAAQAVPGLAVAAYREVYPDVPVVTDDECGSAAAVLAEASRRADVVVLTAHRNTHRIGARLGPVTHALMHHAHCPVVLIPSP
ncbi:universal stress protein [Streptomyces sp. WMMC500]|uniref:universal stress protein n=1 Tax=Streptomyces sp. WMMC500 TaxID=3015154 RepID=UPI00248B80A8|nr:universal stress protein [Streptomyces sp. WMMC500]WBB61946.1 universal stress protein [Streptomyces sp. WMMC500]